MYTRSRQNQSNQQGYGNAQRQMSGPPGNSGSFQNQNYSQQQGNYPTSQNLNQQGNYKVGNMQNSQPFKPQQQQQQQNMSNRNAPQQVKQQMPPQPQQMMQSQPPPNPVPQPQRLKPILKQSSSTPASQTVVSNTPPTPTPQQPNSTVETKVEEQSNEQNTEVEGQEQQQLRRWKRKVPGLKVNRKLKRLRLNQRLRKTLQPKNAIMVLNEMKTGVQFTFPETQASMNSSLFLVHAEIEGKTYVGQGLSKPLARQNAAENALKSLLLEKMTAASMKARLDAESEGQNQTADSTDGVKEDPDGDKANSMDSSVEENDEIPWSSLASFALYKLFLEWQNQGTVVPVPRPGIPVGKAKKEQKPPVQKELPSNAISIHPVMLLNQMRPGLTYVEANRVGNPPNIVFTLAVEVDGVEYHGTAKNKRDAKKAAAKAALNALYNLVYPEDTKSDPDGDTIMG